MTAGTATSGTSAAGSTFVLVPGAGGDPAYWSRLVELSDRLESYLRQP